MSLFSRTFCAIVFVCALYQIAISEYTEESVDVSASSSPKTALSLYFPVRIDSHPFVLPLKPYSSAFEQLQTFCDSHNLQSNECATQLIDSFAQYIDLTRWCRPSRFSSVPFPAVLQLQNNALLQYEWKSADWNTATVALCEPMESEKEKKESDCVSVFQKAFVSTAESVRQLKICQRKRRNDIMDETIHFAPIQFDWVPDEAIENEADSGALVEEILDESIQFVPIRYPEPRNPSAQVVMEARNYDDNASEKPTADIDASIHFVPIVFPDEIHESVKSKGDELAEEYLDESIVFQPIVFPIEASLDSIELIPMRDQLELSDTRKLGLLNWMIEERIGWMLGLLAMLGMACIISYFVWEHIESRRTLTKKELVPAKTGGLARIWSWMKNAVSQSKVKTQIGKPASALRVVESAPPQLRQDLCPILSRCASTGIIEQSRVQVFPPRPLQFSMAACTLALGRDNPRLPSKRALQNRWISQLSTSAIDFSAIDSAISNLSPRNVNAFERLQRYWKLKRVSASLHRQRSHSFSVMEQHTKASPHLEKSEKSGRMEDLSNIQRQNWSRRQSCVSQQNGQDRRLDGNGLSSAA
uniref:AlNc14C30G2804 protein n=1 Tax=Albugo laibachii Nc14 TaxID=890382 RepID=F0W7J8_9STRA|nr:AlNc14C30G2804 [Albugo laibachii Nc14]|eukprot:CCA17099.1 AlNc14C30G2804 [Albugo laibachii Nc14]